MLETWTELWTVDPAKAAAIIESKGYTKNANGFYEKDGKELTMDITTHEAFIEKQRIAQVLVEDFQAAGINAIDPQRDRRRLGPESRQRHL